MSAGYLLSPSRHWITIFDFHEIAFFIPFFLFAWNFLEAKQFALSAFFFALAAGTKEDAILAVLFAGIAITIIYKKDDRKTRNFGLITAGLALVYFILVVKLFMPAFGGGLLRIDRYSHLGGSTGEIILNSLTNPLLVIGTILTAEKLSYLFWLLIPLAGTALFSATGLILILPGLAENLLTNFPAQFSGIYQYDAILLPGIFIGAILGIANLLKRFPERKNIIKYALISTIAAGYLLRSPVNPIFFPIETFQSSAKTEAYSKLIQNIPDNAAVSAYTNIVPHLSQREKIYMIGTEFDRPVDFIVADAGDLSGFADEETFQNYADHYMNSGNYTFEEIGGRYFLLKRIRFSD